MKAEKTKPEEKAKCPHCKSPHCYGTVDIVALELYPGRKIIHDKGLIYKLLSEGYDIADVVERHKAQYMANADLGPWWEALAKGPALFKMPKQELCRLKERAREAADRKHYEAQARIKGGWE